MIRGLPSRNVSILGFSMVLFGRCSGICRTMQIQTTSAISAEQCKYKQTSEILNTNAGKMASIHIYPVARLKFMSRKKWKYKQGQNLMQNNISNPIQKSIFSLSLLVFIFHWDCHYVWWTNYSTWNFLFDCLYFFDRISFWKCPFSSASSSSWSSSYQQPRLEETPVTSSFQLWSNGRMECHKAKCRECTRHGRPNLRGFLPDRRR